MHRNRGSCEKWSVEPTQDIGSFTIRSLEHEHILGWNDQGDVCIVPEPHEWWIVSSPHNGFFLQAVKTKKRLSRDDNGRLFMSENSGEAETWVLDSIMPGTISEKQIWTWVGIGTTTLTVAVAAPFAVMGVIGAMGFEAGGIVGGSMAAGMMSAEAIASGGSIAAGGTVATLQSIGAVGLGAAGTSAAVGGGAVVGGVASAGIATVTHGLDAPQSSVEVPLASERSPLCSWRQW